jgi:hypothetical protein
MRSSNELFSKLEVSDRGRTPKPEDQSGGGSLGTGACVDLALRGGQDTSHVAAELDVAQMS